MLPVPAHPRIRHLGFVSDDDKYDALQAAEFLIMPSYFESLSMVALEAWGMGKPVLANGRCDVLRGQAIRSNAGLYYDSYPEFVEAVRVLESSPGIAATLGRNGRRFFQGHYTWPIVEKKYLDMFARLSREAAADRAGRAMEPLPGWWRRRQRSLRPAREVLAGLPSGPVRGRASSGDRPANDAARRPEDDRATSTSRLNSATTANRATSAKGATSAISEARDQRARTAGAGAPGAPRSRSRRRSRPRSARRAAGAARRGPGVRTGRGARQRSAPEPTRSGQPTPAATRPAGAGRSRRGRPQRRRPGKQEA